MNLRSWVPLKIDQAKDAENSILKLSKKAALNEGGLVRGECALLNSVPNNSTFQPMQRDPNDYQNRRQITQRHLYEMSEKARNPWRWRTGQGQARG